MRKAFVIVIAVLATAGIFYFLFVLASRAAQMPGAVTRISTVNESMDTLLPSLESELEKYDPEIIQSLQPGITVEELERAEARLGQAIHPEMQAFYLWHNGLANDKELFPGHGFWSLEEAIRTNQELAVQYQEKGVSLLMAHEKNWLILFPDSAGDGYYYEPARRYETGGIFYNFREAGYYRLFPSVKNLIRAIVECYQSGAYLPGAEPDFEMEQQIMNKYGVEIQE
jgi:hypothetical protein